VSALELLRRELPELEWRQVEPGAAPAPLPPPGVALAPLRRALRRAARPVLLVNDAARVQPRNLLDLLRELWEEGRTRLLVATGTHKGEPAFYRDRLGGLPAEVHDAGDEAAHDELLTGWALDRRVLEADLVLAFGSVEPHYFAGWTGAHKTATIGVASRATVTRNHEHALLDLAAPCRLDGNPVASDQRVAAELVGVGRRLLCVNQVLDADGRTLASAVGTPYGSLSRVLPAAEARGVVALSGRARLVVADVSGPIGHDLYQADKGLKNWEAALEDGGELWLVAPLPGGVGPDRFLALLRAAPDLQAARARVKADGYRLGDHKAVRWRALEARGVKVRVISPGLAPGALDDAGVEVLPDLAAACARLRAEGRARGGAALRVLDAGNVVARL
jgi:hypothetical protein